MFDDIKDLVSKLVTTVRQRFEAVESEVATMRRDLDEVRQLVAALRAGDLTDLAAEVTALGTAAATAAQPAAPQAAA